MSSTTETRRRPPGLVVAILAMTGVIATGIQTLVVPLIGQLPTILGASPANTSWVVTATLLTSAVTVPIAGRLGDMLGKRPVVMASLVPLIVGSAVCALSGSLAPMIVGRGLQGFGMGVVPLGISLLREAVPPQRVGSAVAMMSASMGIGGALGLPFAAIVGQTTSWRVMFWTFAGLACVALLLVWRLVPGGTRPTGRARFDAPGALLLSSGLVCLLMVVSKGSVWGWTSPSALGLAAGAVLLLGTWVHRQLRVSDPLVNLRSLRDRRMALTTIASVLISFSTYPLSYVVPQILQLPAETGYGLGQSMLAMALWLAPGGLSMLVFSPLSARLSARHGAKTTLALGAGIIAAGFASTIWLMGSTLGLMVVVMSCNIGLGMAYAAIPLIIMDAVAPTETASANGFNTLARAVGTSTAGAVIGAVLAANATQVEGFAAPSLGGFHLALLLGCAVAIVAALLALALPGRSRPARDTPEALTVGEPVRV
ncbi:hypothetical protein GCM10009785_11830 [Brooklawnia cerclae]|uniref:MFS family permease n=1 Tax=Brooklawnia cerclae TaxID=349934 RepID=A0ABX0SNG8_9ACTN|nr:MFS transporter [Brooklawnia cerclae]NIH58590.1 MFS family permease [Brooklawnia cerclae]